MTRQSDREIPIYVHLDVARKFDLDIIEAFVRFHPNPNASSVEVTLHTTRVEANALPTMLWIQWSDGEKNAGSSYLHPETYQVYCRFCQGKGYHSFIIGISADDKTLRRHEDCRHCDKGLCVQNELATSTNEWDRCSAKYLAWLSERNNESSL